MTQRPQRGPRPGGQGGGNDAAAALALEIAKAMQRKQQEGVLPAQFPAIPDNATVAQLAAILGQINALTPAAPPPAPVPAPDPPPAPTPPAPQQRGGFLNKKVKLPAWWHREIGG